MSAPKRLLDDASATAGERALLRAGLVLEPPAGKQDAVWAALVAKLPPPGGAPSGSSPGPGSAAGHASAAKAGAAALGGGVLQSGLVGAGLGLLFVVTYAVAVPAEAPPGVAAPTVAAVAAPSRAAPSATPAPPEARAHAAAASSTQAPPRAAPAAPATNSPPNGGTHESAPEAEDPGSSLREESRLVREAHDALARGDGAAALATLEALAARIPNGRLGQEREAVTIEALARTGQSPAAAARARAFLEAHPDSPHADRVRTFAK